MRCKQVRVVGGSCHVTLDTTIVSICGETWGAEFTDSFVIFNYTGSVSRTGGAFARVLALVSDTCLASGAPAVLQADGDLGVAACGADTHGLVLQHLALLPRRADARLVTRALTSTIVTG